MIAGCRRPMNPTHRFVRRHALLSTQKARMSVAGCGDQFGVGELESRRVLRNRSDWAATIDGAIGDFEKSTGW